LQTWDIQTGKFGVSYCNNNARMLPLGMEKKDRAEAAKRAWETIRARKAAGLYAQPKARTAVGVVQCVPEDWFLLRRVICAFAKSGGSGSPVVGPVAAPVPSPVKLAVFDFDRRELQPVEKGGAK
jgi:hypothetical protein